MQTILLHGFWGQPSDWNAVIDRLPLGASVWVPDLYELGRLSPNHDLRAWTSHFVSEVAARTQESVQIVGYSMGGRLALNALVQAPRMFARSLILSSTPYMIWDAAERENWERDWATRFQNDSWSDLERAWQEQPIFASGSSPLPRRQTPQMREMAGLSLLNWSVRHHPFAAAAIKELPASVDWAFGALDQKYLNNAKLLQELPVKGQISIIENAGHRLVTEASDFIAQWITSGGR